MRYLVTGATGFLGGALARELLSQGHEVHLLVRNRAKAAGLSARGAFLFDGDITHRSSLRKPMTDVDGVFHVAGWYRLDSNDRSEAWRVNVVGTRNVLETIQELGITKAVYTSTLAIFSDTHGRLVDENFHFAGRHITVYDESKWAAHYQVAEPLIARSLPLTIVLPGLIYGPGDTSQVHETFTRLLTGRLRAIPKRTAYCFGYIDDVVDGHIRAMEHGRVGETYIIAGLPYTLEEALQSAAELSSSQLPRLRPGPPVMKATSKVVGALDHFVRIPAGYERDVVKSSAGVTYIGSNAKARHELGYAPRPLEEGLPMALEWEKEQLLH